MKSPFRSRRTRSTLFKILRAMFRMVPMSELNRHSLRLNFLRRFPTVRPLPVKGWVQPRLGWRSRVRADERCIGYVDYSEERLPDPMPAALVAFYLPQFHSIPENDSWWGKGFSEWRNVTRALPQFEGHLQPRLPGDLGFYDLRNPQVMRDQAKLAKTYGLSAFCFYFYWFGGRTLLEEPLRNWLGDKSIDFQYCLCWANESWTRRWDGCEDEVLIGQKHSIDDDLAFIRHVADYLRDPRNLRIDGTPMLLVYRPMSMPEPRATAERWRKWCRENGIGEIHLSYVQSFERPDPKDIGFDSAVEFPPNGISGREVTASRRLLNPDYAGSVLDWNSMADAAPIRRARVGTLFRGINCGWDNEPRRPGHGRVWTMASPFAYQRWLRRLLEQQQTTRASPLFINAWNEWAEGAVLEPDLHTGYAWLHATRRALTAPAEDRQRPSAVIHAWYPQIVPELLEAIGARVTPWKIVFTTGPSMTREVSDQLRRYGPGPFQFEIVEHPNRGRDILPFLKTAARLLHDGHDVVLKLHTKRSPLRSDGNMWRRELVDALVGDAYGLPAYRRMVATPRLGLLVPRGHLQPISYFTGANHESLARLSEQLLIEKTSMTTFASGSMYWVRLASISSLLSAPFSDNTFEDEAGQTDGTFAHTIERIIAPLARTSGYQIEEVGNVSGSAGYRCPGSRLARGDLRR